MVETKVCFWSVQGLDQLHDKLNYITQFDVIVLLETRLDSAETLPFYVVENYFCLYIPASQFQSNTSKKQGGMFIGIRKIPNLSIVDSRIISDDLLVIKLNFNTRIWNLLVIHSKANQFEENAAVLQSVLNDIKDDENLLLMGDFGIRIGTRDGKASQDKEVYGSCLNFLSFKNENCLSILNGTLDDYGGRYTHLSRSCTQCDAVVDYVLVKDSCPYVQNFNVNCKLDALSDHRPLEITISC